MVTVNYTTPPMLLLHDGLSLDAFQPDTCPDLPAACLQDLKEECVKLRTRVFDLEQQNRILSLLFQQRVKVSSTPVSQVTTHPARLWACASETPVTLPFCST